MIKYFLAYTFNIIIAIFPIKIIKATLHYNLTNYRFIYSNKIKNTIFELQRFFNTHYNLNKKLMPSHSREICYLTRF